MLPNLVRLRRLVPASGSGFGVLAASAWIAVPAREIEEVFAGNGASSRAVAAPEGRANRTRTRVRTRDLSDEQGGGRWPV
jgi:hypothetical protein